LAFPFSLSHFVSPSDLPEQVEQYTHHNLCANRGERVVKLFFSLSVESSINNYLTLVVVVVSHSLR
jgi:hypothetical protein